MSKKEPDNGVIKVVETDIGKIGVNTRNGKVLSNDCICQKCGKVLTPTDYFDYICNKCDRI